MSLQTLFSSHWCDFYSSNTGHTAELDDSFEWVGCCRRRLRLGGLERTSTPGNVVGTHIFPSDKPKVVWRAGNITYSTLRQESAIPQQRYQVRSFEINEYQSHSIGGIEKTVKVTIY